VLWQALDEAAAAKVPFLHPRASCAVIHQDAGGKKTLLGHVGEIHPETAIAFDFAADQAPVVFEFDFDAVFTAAEAAAKTVKSTSKVLYRFPPSSRDLALVVKTSVTHDDFEKAIRQFPKQKTLRRFRLFDVYEGTNIPAGMKSMAYTFDFQSPDRTLTDTEVEQEVTALLSWLGEKLEAKQR
jgi:phenylalanyl-tRNA synthetase beta chain